MFLHPWAILIGVVAAGLPVVVHFLTRPRPVRMPLSTLRFLREVIQERRTRHQLRDAIVLLLRTAAVLLLGAVIARPVLGRFQATPLDGANTLRVVVLDASQSMAATVNGIKSFERARTLAAQRLEFRSGLRANLVSGGARPGAVFEQPATNFTALRDALDRSEPLAQQFNVEQALNLAAAMLAQGGTETTRRELVVISDFQRSNWAIADFSILPKDTVIELESVAPTEHAPNLGIVRVATQGRAEAGRAVRLEVDINNDSATARNVRVEATPGAMVFPLSGVCAPQSKTTLVGDITLGALGWQWGEVKLIDVIDSLHEDNVRPFVLEVRPPPKIALVSRQSPTQRPSASYFLECALSASETSAPAMADRESSEAVPAVFRLDAANLDQERLARAEFIVLDHPGRLSPEFAGQLSGFLRRGRGILYVASEGVDADNLRRLIEASEGQVRLPVDFIAPSASQPRRELFVGEVRRDQSPFRVFGDELTTLLRPLRFSGGLGTLRKENTLADDILAQLSDRSALLVSADADNGALVVVNADLGSSNLAGSPLFVPLLGELLLRLSGRSQGAHEVASGEPYALALPSEIDSLHELEIVCPDSAAQTGGELIRESSGVVWKNEAAGPPGAYRVVRRRETLHALATAIPSGESDLRALSAEVFRERLSGGRNVAFHSHANKDRDERDTLWSGLLLACVACVLLELGTLKFFKT